MTGDHPRISHFFFVFFSVGQTFRLKFFRNHVIFIKRVVFHRGVSKNRDTPKWTVKIMEHLIKMDDLGVPPLFLETPI